jgi:hypothetical protein
MCRLCCSADAMPQHWPLATAGGWLVDRGAANQGGTTQAPLVGRL